MLTIATCTFLSSYNTYYIVSLLHRLQLSSNRFLMLIFFVIKILNIVVSSNVATSSHVVDTLGDSII